MARPRSEDVPAAVHELLVAWAAADTIDRSIATRKHGAAPDPAAVPYGWLKWKLRSKIRRRGTEQAVYNALRRTVARMEEAGEVQTWVFTDTGRYAWVLLRISVTEPSGEQNGRSVSLSSEVKNMNK